MSPNTTFESLLGPAQVVPWSNDDPQWTVPENLSIVFPESIEQLSAVVRTCCEKRWRTLSCGQRTKLHWGGQHQLNNIDVVVSTARLNKVVDHWVDDFTARVEAGIPFADFQAKLKLQNQFWPVDPLYANQATIGGIVATADGGSLRQRYGSVRDTVIGIQFVRYDGEVVKAGGRVVKNVAGYDLMKLMTGAYGTLGILSQITLRLYPVAAQSQTIVASGPVAAIAEAALQTRLQGITPVAMDIVGTSSGLQLAGRFQGIATGVQEQVERFQTVAKTVGLDSHAVDDDGEFWSSLAQQLANLDHILCKVGLLPTAMVPLLQELSHLDGWLGRLHNASGLGLITLPADAPEVGSTLTKLRTHCQTHQGYLTLLQRPAATALGDTFDPWGYTGNALGMMRAIKQQFDPHGLLNPGRFVGGI
ncbi:MAG: FAD-binding oxidoreductase [Cyanobacteria bacterium P01_D01_bin.156]